MKRLVIFFIFFLSLVSTLCAEDLRVTSAFDKRAAQIGEEIHLTIRISGAQGNIQAPQLPGMKGFDTFYTGRSSHLTFVNGVSSSSVEFSYVLIPRTKGIYKIPAIEVTVNDQRFATEPVDLEIKEGTAGPIATPQPNPYAQPGPSAPPFPQRPAPQAPSGYSPPPQPPQTQQSVASLPQAPLPAGFQPADDNIFIRAWVDKTSAYPNEQILLTYSLYTRYDTRYEGFEKEPQTSGFWIEDFPRERDVARDSVRFNGKRYIKADVEKIALFATAPADYTIQPGSLKASIRRDPQADSVFDDFFNDSFFSGGGFFSRREDRILQPAPIQLTVKPFPEKGKPESFQGAVGNFRITANLDKTSVKQNEPVTMKIMIEGEGNIETLNKPAVPELPKFKIYDADTSSQLFKTGNVIGGRKNFEIVFIPTESGKQKIPKFEFSFFNPVTAQYVVQQTPEFELQVIPSSDTLKLPESMAQQDLKKEIKKEAQDIRYIKENISDEGAQSAQALAMRALTAGNLFLIGLLGWGLWRRRQESFYAKNHPLKRRRFARTRAEARIRRLKSFKNKDAAAYFEEVEKILTQYLSDKFNLSTYGMTRDELERQLRNILQPTDFLFQEIIELYNVADEARFAKGEVNDELKARALTILRKAISQVERMPL